MIDLDTQLKLQALLDGELSPSEARPLQALLDQDPDAKALVAELTFTTHALKGAELLVKLPESPEFYWSKIQRQIQAPTPATANQVSPLSSLVSAWRRFLVPAGAVAALGLAVLLSLPNRSLIPAVELAVTGANTFTYRDDASRTTLVWVSYPAKNDLAEAVTPDSFE